MNGIYLFCLTSLINFDYITNILDEDVIHIIVLFKDILIESYIFFHNFKLSSIAYSYINQFLSIIVRDSGKIHMNKILC